MLNTKEDILKNVGNQQQFKMVPIDFHIISFPSGLERHEGEQMMTKLSFFGEISLQL